MGWNNKEKAKIYNAMYRATHKEKAKEYNAKWYVANKEKHNAYAKQWAISNPEAIKASTKRYRDANQKKCIMATALWHKLHPENRRASVAKRRARKKNAPGNGITPKQYKKVIDYANGICT